MIPLTVQSERAAIGFPATLSSRAFQRNGSGPNFEQGGVKRLGCHEPLPLVAFRGRWKLARWSQPALTYHHTDDCYSDPVSAAGDSPGVV
jgi:hypothetical protein